MAPVGPSVRIVTSSCALNSALYFWYMERSSLKEFILLSKNAPVNKSTVVCFPRAECKRRTVVCFHRVECKSTVVFLPRADV